ncbi:MAG: arginine--tRNA ligase, partial [Candidatus Diapherotrites archaeon]|nr:arginine--tRNA ligase [Candidatus Diapherotrites archaeon]
MPELKEETAKAIAAALEGKMQQAEIIALIEKPPHADMGDFAFPCFKLAGALRKNPQQIASEIAAKIRLPAGIENAVPAGPYLNFFVRQESLAKKVIPAVLKGKEAYGHSKGGKAKKVMVEYSAPNTNKPLHIGHLRNDSIGMAISSLLDAAGNKVIRANLVNDRGIHICKSMLAFTLFGKGDSPQKSKMKPDHFVGKYYVLYNKKASEQPLLEKQAYELLQKWEKGDKKTLALWKKMNNWVLQGFKETYSSFGSKFEQWFFESKFYDKAGPLIEEGKKKGIFAPNAEGAHVAKLEEHGLPNKIVLRPDGTSIYITNDLALTKHKFERFKLDEALWVVGSEQNLYLQQLFKIFELLGFEWAPRCRHLSYGMVFLPEGKLKS